MSETSVDNNTSGLVLQRQKASDYDNSGPVPQLQNVSPLADTRSLAQQELDLLFGPLYDEFFHAVQTRRQHATDPEICMFALTVSTAEPKNIKEAMVDFARIEEMQEELHQFNRLQVWELIDKPFGKTFRQYTGNLTGYNDVQNIGNQVIQNAVQNPRVQNIGNQNGLIGVQWNGNQNQIGNGNLVAVRAKGNAAGQNENQIRCYNCRGVGHYARNCIVRPRRRDAASLQTQLLIAQKEEAGIQLQAKEYDLMAAAADIDEIEEVNANCILMANLQQASTSGTQTDRAPVYDSDGSAEVHENCDDNDIISEVTSVEQSGETVEQHPANFEETRALYDSLYQNLAIDVEKVNSVNRKLKETNADLTTELARYKNQEKCFEISQEKRDTTTWSRES
nr:Gag-Pol polyprotein [Tanacetum cinerariifolium]